MYGNESKDPSKTVLIIFGKQPTGERGEGPRDWSNGVAAGALDVPDGLSESLTFSHRRNRVAAKRLGKRLGKIKKKKKPDKIIKPSFLTKAGLKQFRSQGSEVSRRRHSKVFVRIQGLAKDQSRQQGSKCNFSHLKKKIQFSKLYYTFHWALY